MPPSHRQPSAPLSAQPQVLSVIIPAYNEEATIEDVLNMVTAVQLPVGLEIVVVDDGSSDETAAIAERWARDLAANGNVTARVISKSNGGKGSAVRAGIDCSTGDYVIIQDADMEYDAADYNVLLEPLLAGEADVCYGSRIAGPDGPGALKFYLGGRLVTLVTNLLYGSRLTDEPTCYKLFRGDLIRSIPLTSTGFEFCPEITAKVLRRGISIAEVPIHYRPRSISEGKKIRSRDGVLACWELLKWRLRS
jgi:glycosyltransferase involved in cell wall biosynthesis